ncbi:holo-ACP synthase [Marinomonas sp. 42_23_T18]|nr:holo-ACP synthase [Marinomonas sp. 42_23_T18]
MILGIGTDIVEIARIHDSVSRLGERFLKRLLTDSEMARYHEIKHVNSAMAFVAKRFAAKEAVAKALGTGIGRGLSFQHIEVSNDALGKPVVSVKSHGNLLMKQSVKWHLSISDERDYAQAFVILEANESDS